MTEFQNSFTDYSILIAEDDEAIRERMVNTLNFYFQSVFHANNGNDAYKIFKQEQPSIIISDIEMKKGTGIEFVQNIRKSDKNTPIIILSAYSKEEYLLKLINLKIEHYLLKPTTTEHLLSALKAALIPKVTKIELRNNLLFDLGNSQLIYHNKTIPLRKKEKIFLELLYNNHNKILTYNMIQEYVWQEKFMTQNALKTFIKELRKKIPLPIIDNVIQEGYRFNYS